MRYREVAKRLRELGCQEGRHRKGDHCGWYNPATNKATSIPDWSSQDLAVGTVRAVIRQLGISRSEFGNIR